MIQPLSLVALTQQDDIAAVTAASSAAALAGPSAFLVVAASWQLYSTKQAPPSYAPGENTAIHSWLLAYLTNQLTNKSGSEKHTRPSTIMAKKSMKCFNIHHLLWLKNSISFAFLVMIFFYLDSIDLQYNMLHSFFTVCPSCSGNGPCANLYFTKARWLRFMPLRCLEILQKVFRISALSRAHTPPPLNFKMKEACQRLKLRMELPKG